MSHDFWVWFVTLIQLISLVLLISLIIIQKLLIAVTGKMDQYSLNRVKKLNKWLGVVLILFAIFWFINLCIFARYYFVGITIFSPPT